MSLVNQVLRDLDRRQADDLGRIQLPLAARSLPEARSRRTRVWVWSVLGVFVFATLMVLWGESQQPPQIRAPEVSAPALAEKEVTTHSTERAAVVVARSPSSGEARLSGMQLTEALTRVPPPSPSAIQSFGAKDEARGEQPTLPERTALQTKLVGQSERTPARPAARSESKVVSGPVTSQAAVTKTERVAKPRRAALASEKPVVTSSGEDRIQKQVRQLDAKQQAADLERQAQPLRQRGQLDAAQGLLAEAVRLDPERVSARLALADSEVAMGQLAAAERTLRAGLDQHPENPALATLAARIQVEQGRLDEALKTLSPAASLHTADARVQGFYATLLQQRQQPQAAVTAFRLAVKAAPGEARWWLGLASALEASGEREAAATAYVQTLQRPGLAPALQDYATERLGALRR